tara:strand:+ start:7820 stop:7987 length:168 start_codon:yes stop_codon:yes gene_type:complete
MKKLDQETSAMMMDMQLSNIATILNGDVKRMTASNKTHKWKKIEIVYDYSKKEDT